MVIAIVTLCRMQFGNTAEFNLLVETIVAGRGHAFSSFAFTGANDEKVGLLGSLPRVASAARTYPGLSSVALFRAGALKRMFSTEQIAYGLPVVA
jgi:hypothetical protein